jgi:hypothetical protein
MPSTYLLIYPDLADGYWLALALGRVGEGFDGTLFVLMPLPVLAERACIPADVLGNAVPCVAVFQEEPHGWDVPLRL